MNFMEHKLLNQKKDPTDPTCSFRPFYVNLLCEKLTQRKQRNPRYSLRAFAYFLGLDPSALSRILAGKQDLSLRAAKNIIQTLQLTGEEKNKSQISFTELMEKKAALFFPNDEPTAFRNQSGTPPLPGAPLNHQKVDSMAVFTQEVISVDPGRIEEAGELVR